MSESPPPIVGECQLEAVIATEHLASRPARPVNLKAETEALLRLSGELARAPQRFFATLVEAVLKLSQAESAGVSLLNEAEGRFVWPAIAGGLSPHVQGGTPRNFGPCGTVLDQNKTLLMVHPERHFAYLKPLTPPLEQVLLIPFYVGGKAVGTIWAVIHEPGRSFDREDKRLLDNLADFAATAYETLESYGLLEPFLQVKADASSQN